MPKLKSHRAIEFLALEGGGGKGVAYLGAIRALEELGVLPISIKNRGDNQVKGISGASAGAITALMLAMGVTSHELEIMLKDAKTFRKFYDGPDIGLHRHVNARNVSTVHADPDSRGRAPAYLIQERLDSLEIPLSLILNILGGKDGRLGASSDISRRLERHPVEYFYNFLFDRGLFPGFAATRFFQTMISRFLGREMLAAGGGTFGGDQITGNTLNFETFYRITGVDLVVTGVNITTKRPGLFSRRFTPKFPVADAVAISMSFPFAFKPVLVDAEVEVGTLQTDRRAYCGRWIDGGVLNNLPIHAFDHFQTTGALHTGTLGLRLVDGPASTIGGKLPPSAPDSLVSDMKKWYLGTLTEHLLSVLDSALWPSEEGQLRTEDERAQTIELPTFDLETLEFAPPPEKSREPVRVAREKILGYFS